MAAVRAPAVPLKDGRPSTSPCLGFPLVLPLHRVRNVACSACTVKFQHQLQPSNDRTGRRELLFGVGVVLALSSLQSEDALAERDSMKGFKQVIDKGDGYLFYHPFGWEEIIVQGQDVVYKDVIEPLESVSVNVVKTSKNDIHEFGTPEELSKVLIDKFLAPTQKAQLIEAKERETDGTPYYEFEFLAKAPNYTRHALAAVTAAKGKFYALVTGANERRWNKMKDRLHTVVDSFALLK